MRIRFQFFIAIILVVSGCTHDPEPLPVLPDTFSAIQKQTFDVTCNGAGCHDVSTMKSLLCLVPDSAYRQLMTHQVQQNGTAFKALVVPGNPDSSFLVFKITKATEGDVEYGDLMPNNNTGRLPQNQIDAIISWIRRGAPND